MNKKLTATILTAVMATNLAITPAFAAANVTYNGNTTYIGDNNQGGVLTEPTKPSITFSDVKSGDWYYEPVMAMAEMGKTAKEIKAYLEETKMDSVVYITVDTLKYLKKN